MNQIRVYIADDHPVFRYSLERLLQAEPDVELLGACADGLTASREMLALAPDVAVLDLRLPGVDGIQVVERLRDLALPTHVMILTAHIDRATVYRALAAGARGVMDKAASAEEIVAAVLSVARGGVVIPPFVGAMLADEVRHRSQQIPSPALSAREIEVLQLATDGATAEQIGRALSLSVATVRTHFSQIYTKLGVSDRAAAVAIAIRTGLLN